MALIQGVAWHQRLFSKNEFLQPNTTRTIILSFPHPLILPSISTSEIGFCSVGYTFIMAEHQISWFPQLQLRLISDVTGLGSCSRLLDCGQKPEGLSPVLALTCSCTSVLTCLGTPCVSCCGPLPDVWELTTKPWSGLGTNEIWYNGSALCN